MVLYTLDDSDAQIGNRTRHIHSSNIDLNSSGAFRVSPSRHHEYRCNRPKCLCFLVGVFWVKWWFVNSCYNMLGWPAKAPIWLPRNGTVTSVGIWHSDTLHCCYIPVWHEHCLVVVPGWHVCGFSLNRKFKNLIKSRDSWFDRLIVINTSYERIH